MKKEKNPSVTGNMDEGFNEGTRLPYTDSISTRATKDSIKNNKNKKK